MADRGRCFGNYYTITEPTFVYNSTTNTNVLVGERTTGSQITMQEFKLDSNGDPYFTLGPKVIIEGSNQDRQRMAYSTTDELMVLVGRMGPPQRIALLKIVVAPLLKESLQEYQMPHIQTGLLQHCKLREALMILKQD